VSDSASAPTAGPVDVDTYERHTLPPNPFVKINRETSIE
jgi:hypothetical protein